MEKQILPRNFLYKTFLAGLCMALLSAYPLPQDNDQIVWGTKTITWDDFQGPYNRKSSGIASTYSYMDMDISKNGEKVSVELKAVFDKKESWVVYREKSVLNHERGHFNITELYARRLRKKISETRFSRNNYKQELLKLYEEYDRAMDKYHDQYDEETDSSMDTPKQKAWEAAIIKNIQALDVYKKITLEIKFSED